ncbi:branched-chain amino acid ABC transporter permease [Actinophytocola sp.]|uniref:branched-chain amino acid ABC transporter permease n=1 Tax=Actinophytocola sp. TaxID=1872138 RepID=UPI003D6C4775
MNRLLVRDLGGAVGVFAVLAVFTYYVADQRVVLLGTFMTFVTLAVSLDLMVGTTGMLSMGHAAFFGVGAYASTLLAQNAGWSLPLAGLAALGIVAVVALLVGLPATSRTAGLYFAIVTFAFGELLVQLVNNTTAVSGGSEGLPVTFGLEGGLPDGWTVYRFITMWIAGLLLLTLVVTALVRNTSLGPRLMAVRESENLTRGLGFNPTFYKTVIFVLSSVIAAAAGVLYAPMVGFINPDLMGVEQSIYILGLLYVGGMGSVTGAFVGVGVLATLPQLYDLDPVLRPVIVGVAMAVVVLLAPDRGIVGLLRDLLRWLTRGLRRWRGGPPVAASAGRPLDDLRTDVREHVPAGGEKGEV